MRRLKPYQTGYMECRIICTSEMTVSPLWVVLYSRNLRGTHCCLALFNLSVPTRNPASVAQRQSVGLEVLGSKLAWANWFFP